MKLTQALATILAAGTVLTVSGFALAQPGPRPGDDRQLNRLSAELNLSSEQEAAIRAIYENAKTDSADERRELQSATVDLKSALASDASDDQLRQQHEDVQELRDELADISFETLLEVRQELTPEQRERFAQLRFQQRNGRGPRSDFGAAAN